MFGHIEGLQRAQMVFPHWMHKVARVIVEKAASENQIEVMNYILAQNFIEPGADFEKEFSAAVETGNLAISKLLLQHVPASTVQSLSAALPFHASSSFYLYNHLKDNGLLRVDSENTLELTRLGSKIGSRHLLHDVFSRISDVIAASHYSFALYDAIENHEIVSLAYLLSLPKSILEKVPEKKFGFAINLAAQKDFAEGINYMLNMAPFRDHLNFKSILLALRTAIKHSAKDSFKVLFSKVYSNNKVLINNWTPISPFLYNKIGIPPKGVTVSKKGTKYCNIKFNKATNGNHL